MENYIENVRVETNNLITIQGTVFDEPKHSHYVRYEDFYEFNLIVKRMSYNEDCVPIIMPANCCKDLHKGMRICIEGTIKSKNKILIEGFDSHSKLLVYVFANKYTILDEYDIDYNEVVLRGRVCKNTYYRTTPFGKEICDIMLAVNAKYNKSYYIPIIAWGRNARYAGNLHVNDVISIVGRFQSREYNKNYGETVETKTTYEVSAMEVKKIE